MEKQKTNPYSKEGKDSGVEAVNAIKKRCLEKGSGVMFKLFDLGKLGLDGDKILVFKNNVGDLVREFIRALEQTGSTVSIAHNLANLEHELLNLGKYTMGNADKYNFYEDKVKKVLAVLKD